MIEKGIILDFWMLDNYYGGTKSCIGSNSRSRPFFSHQTCWGKGNKRGMVFLASIWCGMD